MNSSLGSLESPVSCWMVHYLGDTQFFGHGANRETIVSFNALQAPPSSTRDLMCALPASVSGSCIFDSRSR